MNNSNVNNTNNNNNQTDDLLVLEPIPSIVSDEKSLENSNSNVGPGQPQPILSLIDDVGNINDDVNNTTSNDVLEPQPILSLIEEVPITNDVSDNNSLNNDSEPILDLIEEVPNLDNTNNNQDDDFIQEQPVYSSQEDDLIKPIDEDTNGDLSEMNSLNTLLQPTPIPSLRGSKKNSIETSDDEEVKLDLLSDDLNSNDKLDSNDSLSTLEMSSNNSKLDKASKDNNLVNYSVNNVEIDESLVKAYVGENYDKIVNTKFSIPGFFLGQIYLFYRKMYLVAFLVIVASFILLFLNLGIVSLLINVAVALLFSNVYISYVKSNVAKIVSENKDKTQEELTSICAKKGGTSVGALVLAIIIQIVVIIFGILSSSMKEFLDGLRNGTLFSDDEVVEEYKGVLYTNNSVDSVKEYFSVNVPNVFKQRSKSYYYEYETESDSDIQFKSCEFSLGVVENFTDVASLAEQMSEFYNGDEVTVKSINNIDWKTFSYINGGEKKYYYMVNAHGKVFMAMYMIESGADALVCEKYHTDIMNSVSFK